jgi:DNA-binding transcriptional LysR family regulator
MRQEISAFKNGLAGRLRIAAIPSTLPILPALTTPYRARHPDVQFVVLARRATEMFALLRNHEIDACITYIDVDPLDGVTTIPLYRERYRLLIARDAPLGNCDGVTWADFAKIPLCLFTPDTTNRGLVERLLRARGGNPRVTLESDSMTVLLSHVRTGHWASVMPEQVAGVLGFEDCMRAIPIAEPDVEYNIGLIVPARELRAPLTIALVDEAKRFVSEHSRN